MTESKRPRRPSDFSVKVEGIGSFVFANRTMADELAVQREYAEIIGGVEHPTIWLETMGGWLSALRVLTVSAPDGWDIDAMDPLDTETYKKIGRVYEELQKMERSFRQGPKPSGEAVSA